MSDSQDFEDTIEVPEGDSADFADQQVKRGMSPALKFGILIGGVALILGGSIFFSSTQTSDPPSAVRSVPNLDATPGGAIQAENERFQEILRRANDDRATEAEQRRETFIPTPESTLEPLDRFDRADAQEVSEPEPEPAPEPEPGPAPEPEPEPRVIESRDIPAVTPPRRPRVETTAPDQEENPYIDGMVQQMGSITRGTSTTTAMQVESQGLPQEMFQEPENESADASGDGASDAPTIQATILPAGEILYGQTLTSSSSDLPGPVLVEITTGEFKGSRLVGTFSTGENVDRMVVEFSSMTLPEGETVDVSAVAVDGMSAETAVASDVDRRYVRRYAPILAASFLTGYANARAQPSQEIVERGDGVSVVTGQSDEEESLFAGLGAASEAIGSDLVQNAPQGPEIKLRSGWPLGVMFIEPVTDESGSW